jgi:hypothetical protein
MNILDLGVSKQTINTPTVVTKIVYITKTQTATMYDFLHESNRFLTNINMNSIDINESLKNGYHNFEIILD